MIRRIKRTDRAQYLAMVRDFYESDAVCHRVKDTHFTDTFDELMQGSRYLEGYIFEIEGQIAGYALIMKTFSQEAGGLCAWIDELYVKRAFRGQGLGRSFLLYARETILPRVKRLRLEVSPNNPRVFPLYEEAGFQRLAYLQMNMDRSE